MVAECGFFSFNASVRELAAPTAGIVVVVGVYWGRLGRGLGSAPWMAPSRPYDGGHGAGDGPPSQRTASEVCEGGDGIG